MLAVAIRYGLPEEADAIASLVNRSANEVARLFDRGSFLVLDRPGGQGLAGSVYLRMEGERAEVGLLSVAPDVSGPKEVRERLLEVADMLSQAHGCRLEL